MSMAVYNMVCLVYPHESLTEHLTMSYSTFRIISTVTFNRTMYSNSHANKICKVRGLIISSSIVGHRQWLDTLKKIIFKLLLLVKNIF